jgi:hypothetical protein
MKTDFNQFAKLVYEKKFIERKITFYNKKLKEIEAEINELNKRIGIGV